MPWVVIKFGGTSVSRRERWENIRRIAQAHRQRGRRVLMPQRFDYYRDEDYLFPLLANLARAYPSAAAKAGISRLRAD